MKAAPYRSPKQKRWPESRDPDSNTETLDGDAHHPNRVWTLACPAEIWLNQLNHVLLHHYAPGRPVPTPCSHPLPEYPRVILPDLELLPGPFNLSRGSSKTGSTHRVADHVLVEIFAACSHEWLARRILPLAKRRGGRGGRGGEWGCARVTDVLTFTINISTIVLFAKATISASTEA